jgi:hypothetical protein
MTLWCVAAAVAMPTLVPVSGGVAWLGCGCVGALSARGVLPLLVGWGPGGVLDVAAPGVTPSMMNVTGAELWLGWDRSRSRARNAPA